MVAGGFRSLSGGMVQVESIHLLREIRSTPPPAVRIDLVILPVAPVKWGIVLEISASRSSFPEEDEKGLRMEKGPRVPWLGRIRSW